MDSLNDLPVVGGVASGVAVVGDLLLNSGDLVISLLSFVASSPELWLSVVTYANSAARYVAWLPQGLLRSLMVAGFFLMIGISAARLVEKWRASS